MTESQVYYLQETLSKGLQNRFDGIWIKAFELYNAANKEKEKSMNCSPCYNTIYKYHLNKIEKPSL